MLQLSPQLIGMLRTVQPTTEEKLRSAGAIARQKRSVRKINQARRNHLIDRVAAILRTGETSKFEFEASCRHGLRSSLCLQGWSWADADQLAAEIVAAALNRIGAERPSWKEGQPEYTQEGVIIEHRATCLRCRGGPLPEGHWKFCSSLCANAHKQSLMRLRRAEELAAMRHARRAVEKNHRQPERPCETCRRPFAPSTKAARFCCTSCANKGRAVNHPWRY